MKKALFIRHTAKPGLREEVFRVWETCVKPRAEANPAHEHYFFCFDEKDPDVICVFQLYSSRDAMAEFLAGEWYPEYLAEIGKVVAEDPQVRPAELVWSKR